MKEGNWERGEKGKGKGRKGKKVGTPTFWMKVTPLGLGLPGPPLATPMEPNEDGACSAAWPGFERSCLSTRKLSYRKDDHAMAL